jgi:recombinational DNA repair protein RecR
MVDKMANTDKEIQDCLICKNRSNSHKCDWCGLGMNYSRDWNLNFATEWQKWKDARDAILVANRRE